jgi:hypothetical protein
LIRRKDDPPLTINEGLTDEFASSTSTTIPLAWKGTDGIPTILLTISWLVYYIWYHWYGFSGCKYPTNHGSETFRPNIASSAATTSFKPETMKCCLGIGYTLAACYPLACSVALSAYSTLSFL